MEILAKLGIDWKLFVAQIVNFAILFLVLRRFAYRPMIEFLDKRTERIEQGLKDADEARKRLDDASDKEREILDQAKKAAQEIIAKAEAMSKKNYEKALEDAKADATRLIEQARKNMEAEKSKLLVEAKAELVELVMLSTEKILGEKLDAGKNGELIQRHLREAK